MSASNSPNKFWLLSRSLWFYAAFSLVTIILGIISFPAMLLQLSGIMFRFAVLWGRSAGLLAGMRLQTDGSQNIYRDGPVIVIANHQSAIDIPAFYMGMQIPFAWMAKASVFRVPIIGWAMKAMRCVPVERENRKKAMQSLYKAAEMIRKGHSVIIFPEGTFGKKDGSLGPFKKGSFILAKLAKVAIQPVTLWGTANVAPDIADHTIQRFYRGKAHIIFHPPILPDEFENMDADQLSQHLRRIIEAPIAKLQQSEPLIYQATAAAGKELPAT